MGDSSPTRIGVPKESMCGVQGGRHARLLELQPVTHRLASAGGSLAMEGTMTLDGAHRPRLGAPWCEGEPSMPVNGIATAVVVYHAQTWLMKKT